MNAATEQANDDGLNLEILAVWDAVGNLLPGCTDAAADPVGFELPVRFIDPVRSTVGSEVRIQLTEKSSANSATAPPEAAQGRSGRVVDVDRKLSHWLTFPSAPTTLG